MATIKQEQLAKAIVKNVRNGNKKNAKELLVSTGYSQSTASAYPGTIIAQPGVQEELKKLGFDEESAKKVVGQILGSAEKDADRIKAADLIFKVVGSYAPQKLDVETNVGASSTTIQAMAAEVALKLKEKKLNEQDEEAGNSDYSSANERGASSS